MTTDAEILENNYRIEKVCHNYYGYKLIEGHDNSIVNSTTLGWTKHHLIDNEISLKYFDAYHATTTTLEKDNHDSNFLEMIDSIFNLISETLEKKEAKYFCSYFIEGKNHNDVFKSIEYLNYKKFRTNLTARELIISW